MLRKQMVKRILELTMFLSCSKLAGYAKPVE